MHIIIETAKQLGQAFLVYGFLIFGYSQVSDAAICLSPNNVWYSATSGGAVNQNATFYAGAGTFSPEQCARFILTGDEYTNLIKNRIDAANINITTLQGNDQTLQNNLQTVSTALNQANSIIQQHQIDIDALKLQMQTNGLRDENNFLHINHEDSMTFFYAVLGLFATAFVWRFARHSLTVADSGHVSE